MNARTGRFFWAVHPAHALAEAWLVGLAVVGWLSWLAGVRPQAIGNGWLFLCGAAGIWAVLRTRVPGGGIVPQVAYELAMSCALSAGMVLLLVPARSTGLLDAWEPMGLPAWLITIVLALTGAGYLACRVGVRLWLVWDRLRRRHMRWALTHAHLMLVLAPAAALMLTLAFVFMPGPTLPDESGFAALPADITTRFLTTVFPTVSLLAVVAAMVVVSVLPPSAIFSYFVAHRTTRRLETLTRATAALRAGDLSARVPVAGEDELAQLQADFNAMADTLQHTLAELEGERDNVSTLLRARRDLVASVSHELRTPVATVRAALDAVLDHWDERNPGEMRRDLTVAESEVLRMQSLIDDLFTLARAEVDALSLRLEPVDAAAAVNEIVAAMARLAWESGRVEVLAQTPASLPPARADRERLKQVVANLVRNAVRHTPPGGIVVVAAQAEADSVRIDVRDTGDGIAPDDVPHIWERYYRGETDARTEGAGLGLALVRELTEAMGGRVGLENQPGEGACFVVRLPRAR